MRDDLLRGRARAMRREPTEAERRLWALLRGRRLVDFKFRRQTPIGPYIADFVCLRARLIVELDGGQHAESRHDLRRDAWLRSEGFEVLRFWNAELFENPSGIVYAIAMKLGLPWTP